VILPLITGTVHEGVSIGLRCIHLAILNDLFCLFDAQEPVLCSDIHHEASIEALDVAVVSRLAGLIYSTRIPLLAAQAVKSLERNTGHYQPGYAQDNHGAGSP
jgi:hypothetical protein